MSAVANATFSDCLLCLEEMSLGVLSVINCGHVYHFECIQGMYKNDRECGRKSSCAICRQAIMSAPNKIFGNFSTERISYSVGESLGPNVTGKRGRFQDTEAHNGDNSRLQEQVQFYEGRLADLEAQIEELEEIEEVIEELRADNLMKKNEISELKRKLNDRDLKVIETVSKMDRINGNFITANCSIKALECRNAALKVELDAAKTELSSFQDCKIAIETERLASEITKLQSDSYFLGLPKSHTPAEIIKLLSGMYSKYKRSANKRNELEKENRRLRIEMERMAKRTKTAVRIERVQTPIEDDDETELENDPIPFLQLTKRPTPQQPAALNVSKLVPSIRPKGLAISRGTTTGTGMRSKIMEMPNGTKRIV